MSRYSCSRVSAQILAPCLLAGLTSILGCGSDDSSGWQPPSFSGTIQEGRAAANDVLAQTGAASLSVAFVAGHSVVWAETFGLANKETQTPPATDTMYGIGSVSKMFATVAIMKLVDQGKVLLDAPVTAYLPSFTMLSPEYAQVTVRMLLNHSSGFPGTDYRNSETSEPVAGYARQVLQSLGQERLKYTPGYLNVYCNDGFTLTELVVAAVTGKSYVQFVQDEIFTPLRMTHSMYSLSFFPEDSFAHTYSGDTPNPQGFVNAYGSGGLYSTPSDMAQLAMVFLRKGARGGMPVLSEDAVSEMATDQTLGTFNPVPSDGERFGIGWDTVSEPGLKAAGVNAWAKGGDAAGYGSYLMVVPSARLGVMVSGASGFSSTNATVVAQRIMLEALVDLGWIPAMPVPLAPAPRPTAVPASQQLAAFAGYYASSNALFRATANADSSITVSNYTATGSDGWTPAPSTLKLRDDGLFSSDDRPLREYYVVSANNRTFLVIRDVQGAGHYQDDSMFAEKIAPVSPLSDAWANRLNRHWLVVNEDFGSLDLTGGELFTVSAASGLDGLIYASSQPGTTYVLDPSQSDTMGAMMLVMPYAGRDLNDLFVVTRNGEEWLRFGSYVYRPQETIAALPAPTNVVVIGSDGFAEWRTIPSGGSPKYVGITSSAPWKIFDAGLSVFSSGTGTGTVTLPSITGNFYLELFGLPNDYITVEVN